MSSADNLAKARRVRAQQVERRRKAGIKQAQAWLKLMREEVQARQRYNDADEPRAKERARKYWLHVRDDWGKIGTPKDEYMREARKLERSDA